MRKYMFILLGLMLTSIAFPAVAQYGRANTQGVTTSTPNKPAPPPTLPVIGKPAAAPAVKPDAKPIPETPELPTFEPGENVVVFFDDFSIKKTIGGQIFCQMTFYGENNTKKQLDSLVVELEWPGISANVAFESVPPDDLKTSRYALAGEGCYTMGTEPKMQISKCMMRAFDKFGKVIDVPESMCKNIVSFR